MCEELRCISNMAKVRCYTIESLFLNFQEKNQDKMQTVYVEGKGPGNVILIFQLSSENPLRSRNDLASLYKKCG